MTVSSQYFGIALEIGHFFGKNFAIEVLEVLLERIFNLLVKLERTSAPVTFFLFFGAKVFTAEHYGHRC